MLSWPFSLKENGAAMLFPLRINRRNALGHHCHIFRENALKRIKAASEGSVPHRASAHRS
jgi:hypothetical protein